MRFGIVVCLLLSSAACDNEERPPAPPVVVDGDYASPDAFDQARCQPGAVAALEDIAGVWHLDMAFAEFGRFPGAMRLDPAGENGVYTALVFGREADITLVDSDRMFLRRAFETSSGLARIQALYACAGDGDGGLVGQYATCTDGECFLGEFTARATAPLDEPVAAGVRLIAEHAGSPPWPADEPTVNVRVADGMAYLARYGDGLRIVDLSRPDQPLDRGHAPVLYPDEEIYNDVKIVVADGVVYALCASSLRGVVVIDVSDPDAPIEITSFPQDPLNPNSVSVHTLFVDAHEGTTRAYLANLSTAGIDIFDVADPRQPQRLGGFVHPLIAARGGFVHDLFVAGGRVYLNYWNLGMIILDAFERPAEPIVVGTFEEYGESTSHSAWATDVGGRRVALHGDEQWNAHLNIVDVDDKSATFLDAVAVYQTRPQVSIHNVMAIGSLALVTYYQDGLRLLDISDPLAPREVGHYQTWPGTAPAYGHSFYEGAIGVDFDSASQTIYLADTHRGLFVLAIE